MDADELMQGFGVDDAEHVPSLVGLARGEVWFWMWYVRPDGDGLVCSAVARCSLFGLGRGSCLSGDFALQSIFFRFVLSGDWLVCMVDILFGMWLQHRGLSSSRWAL